MGRLLRGDLLADIPAESQAALVSYGIRTAVDLRPEAGLLQKPSVLAHSAEIEYVHHNLLGDDEVPYSWDSPRGIADGYCWILEARKPQVKETLSTLAVPQALPAVFYCDGGPIGPESSRRLSWASPGSPTRPSHGTIG